VNKYIRPRFIFKCEKCKGDFESKRKKSLCPDCIGYTRDSELVSWRDIRRSEKMKKKWKNKTFLFNFFKGYLFGKNYKPNELDKKIIRTRIRLFKIQRKEVSHESS